VDQRAWRAGKAERGRRVRREQKRVGKVKFKGVVAEAGERMPVMSANVTPEGVHRKGRWGAGKTRQGLDRR